MKTIQSLVLAAIVLGTSACASNAAKHQPTAALTGAPAPASIARSVAIAGAVVDANASLADTSVQELVPSNTMSELAAPTSRPPVSDPWEGFNRKMHGFNNVLVS